MLNGHPNPTEEAEVDRPHVVAGIIDPVSRSWRLDDISDIVSEVEGNTMP